MLSRVFIDGYKSIDTLDMKLQNFTLLSGVNSAGKSSVLQAILYMIQKSKENGEQDNYIDLGKFTDIRNNIKGNKKIVIELDIEEQGKLMNSSVDIEKDDDTMPLTTSMFTQTSDVEEYVNCHKVIFLSVERIGVQRAYDMNTDNPKNIGNKGEYVYSYLAQYGIDKLPEIRFACKPEEIGMSLNNQVNYWMDYLIGFHVQTNIIPDVDQVVVTYANAKSNKYYRAKNVGTGVTYLSTLIIAALTCSVDDTLIIENPEIHLHPSAQSKFMEFLAFLSQRGLQVIVETHSDHIYNGMRKSIKKKDLSKDKVKAYFLKLSDMMQTETFEININEAGAEENHPYGLFDQFDDDLDELLDM